MNKDSKRLPKVGDNYEIPVEGSLGVFALGYRGVTAWRKVRDAAKAHSNKEKKEDQNDNIK